MTDFTIVITTFSKRYGFIERLINQIRTYCNSKIIVTINGEKNGEFHEDYRKKMLLLCEKYNEVFPIFFIETRGLSKMWNTGIIMSEKENVLVLNDDIEINSDEIFKVVNNHIVSNDYHGLTKINNSFSHFIVNKTLIDKIGYFDERLLGFGEEDGDIVYRLLKLNLSVINIYVNNVINIISDIRHEHIKKGIGKYSNFNREFIYSKKYLPSQSSPYKGMFDTPMIQLLPDINQYPYEGFFNENKKNL